MLLKSTARHQNWTEETVSTKQSSYKSSRDGLLLDYDKTTE